jgi:hypothetical protein
MREYAYWGKPSAGAGVPAGATETLYWNPRLIVGGDGKAVVEFAWPGSAAAYRVLVDGHFAGRIGSYQSEPMTSETGERGALAP